MKLLRLNLIAFGPFTDRTLDFSESPRELQIILGSNEAGKSTSLRALEGLLFGIDARSPDAHTHPYGELRVGGVLEGQNGELLEIVRRKGIKGTLRDTDGQIMDEAKLLKLLRGVDADAFRALYGLNHETLRLGADALERAQGKVGESLFDAGLGGLGVGPTITALGEEADALFTPQARKKPLNEAIRSLVETRKQVRIAETNPEAKAIQERGIEASIAEAQEAEAERRALIVEQARLTRVVRAAPLLDKRRALMEARALLGPVVLLPSSAKAEREQAIADRIEAQTKLTRIEAEVVRLRAKADGIDAPAELLALALDIERLGETSTKAAAAIEERASTERDLEIAERRLRELETHLGESATRLRTEKLKLDPPLETMALERDTGALKLREIDLRLGDLEALRTKTLGERADLPSVFDGSELAARIDAAATMTEMPMQLDLEEAELAKLGARIESDLAALGLFVGTAADLASSRVPPVELCLAAERAERERDERKRANVKTTARLESSARDLTREIETLLRAGSVPTEADLEASRRARDELVERMKGAGAGGRKLFDSLTERVREADGVADRLRREASRVERHAQLGLALKEANAALSEARIALVAIEDEERTALENWREAWRSSGIVPLGATEMRSWLDRRKALVDSFLDLMARLERVTSSRLRVREAIDGLDRSASHERAPHDLGTLAQSVAFAKSLVSKNERSRLRHETLEMQLVETKQQLDARSRERDERDAAQKILEAQWTHAMTLLALDGSASSAVALARQTELHEIARLREDSARKRTMLDRIDARQTELRRDLEQVARLSGAELSGLVDFKDPFRSAQSIAKRFAEARKGEDDRAVLRAQLQISYVSADDERARLSRAESKIAEQALAAEVDEADLPRAEMRSQEALRLDREIDVVEQGLRAHADGLSIADLEVERASLVGIEVGVRLDELCDEIERSEARRDHAHHDKGARTEGLRKLEHEAKAADLAVVAEGHLARAASLLRRHAVARLAKVVLEREVERYRQSHQGPIVERARELYRRLTVGRYEDIQVVYGDSAGPELRCIRGGKEVEVAGLSDGTRDQLFLALRLATLERHAAEGEPMPLVLDDVFVHFDDERTRAALEVLAELSSVVQVLLFTHHARVVELCERKPRLAFGLNRL